MIRSIYAKIFLWFWAAVIAATLAVMLFTAVSGSRPLRQYWMSVTADLYARGAVDIYLQGGEPALQKYMTEVEQSLQIHAALLDPQGKDILGKGMPTATPGLLAELRSGVKTPFHGGAHWTQAVPVPTPQGNFILLVEVNLWRVLESLRPGGGFGLKFLIALLSTGLLCAALARHIATPIRALQAAAARIANGDLSVRAFPAIAPRQDELADLAQDFDRMAERIQALLQKQYALLADISHELRSPLARLNVSLELLRRGEGDAVGRMQDDLDRLEGLIGQILTLTRLRIPEDRTFLTTVNLRSIVEGVAEDARFEGKKEEKSVVIIHAEDCSLAGDPALLRSCIENVVRNAVRYTKPSTGVIITLSKVDWPRAAARVVVVDHGDGVPAESLDRLFEPFYRVSESRDARTGGFGLGLAIAQRVVLLHGGKIIARNRDCGGLEMEIDLPLKVPAPTMG